MSLRITNCKYLLTWPQSDILNIEKIYEHLASIEDIEYCVICEEEHENEGKHFHAVVIYKKRLNKRTNVFTCEERVCNIQKIGRTKRDLKDSIAYVKKDGKWKEYGRRPEDISMIRRKEKLEFIRSHTVKECFESGIFSFSELRSIECIKANLKETREDRERVVYWFHGPTGSGKTREAFKIAREYYTEDEICILTGNNREFKNGYLGQRCVIFDDFRNGDVRFNELLALCDRYPVNVNIKGSTSKWLADLIIFTCPNRPEDVFVKCNQFTGDITEREDLQQLIRRINEIREFP
nr:replication-associated protein [Cressdnaviricota sp.]